MKVRSFYTLLASFRRCKECGVIPAIKLSALCSFPLLRDIHRLTRALHARCRLLQHGPTSNFILTAFGHRVKITTRRIRFSSTSPHIFCPFLTNCHSITARFQCTRAVDSALWSFTYGKLLGPATGCEQPIEHLPNRDDSNGYRVRQTTIDYELNRARSHASRQTVDFL